jgi:alpha-1,3-mannosylglycoprotein beta-1,4-N-acetylglucosaminyltransferase A/B
MDHLRSLDKEKSKAFVELQSQLNRYLSDPRPSDDDLESRRRLANAYSDNNMNVESAASINSWPIPAPFSSQSAAANLSGININQTLSELYRHGLVADLSPIGADLAVPNIYDHLPHLLRNQKALSPVVRISKNRRHVQMTIGIPTIKRSKVSYLITTLRSLIDNLQPSERSEVLIVVFFAELNGLTEFITEQVATIYNEFPDAIKEGLLEILVPAAAFYPDLDAIPPTFDDSPERMKWRTKQNLDYCYLMMYCQNRATYYMQLEDDVITKPGYYEKIKEYIRKQSSTPWYLLEFSSLGFIGKLFRSSDLSLMIDFLLMFHKEKPADWLLDHIFYVRLCNPEKSPKQCQQTKSQYRLLYKPSLFQHIGVHSSLKGKVQKLKEKDFGKAAMHKAHSDNPPAEVTTSLKTYQKYTVESAYKGETFFWGLLPQPGDWIKL